MNLAAPLRPSPGPSFAKSAWRPRLAGASDERAAEKLRALTGDDARWLSAANPLLFDADVCTFEGDALRTSADFWRVIRADALARVGGAYVLAWRTPSNGIALARDPIGHRTLFYTEQAGQLWFASSLYALRRALPAWPGLDERAIAMYLSCAYVPGRSTILKGIWELLPGELLTFEHGQLRRQIFWDLAAEPPSFASEADLQASLRATLEQQVRALLPADGPVAASLSGGIDSSLVVALARRLHAAPVHTFSLSFGLEYPNELEFSSLVAEHCQTVHHVVELSPRVVSLHLDDTMACLDKPNGDPLTVPNALLFRTMSERTQVALNGEGGDPCFGGPKNVPMILAALYGDGESDSELQRERSYLRAHAKCFDDLSELLLPDVFARATTPPLEDELTPWFADARFRSFVSRLFAINVRWKGGHHILPKIAALSAPFGVSARSPLFSKAAVELAFAIPPQLKLRGSVEKYLLKGAVEDLLPDRIVNRPKSGMMVPVEGWFQPRGPLYFEARSRVLDGLHQYGLFARSQLEELVSGRRGGLRPRRGVKLWLLIALESHLRALRETGS